MLHHAAVILIIACPLGLFAALVATGCRVFRSDLARAGWIGIALLPVLVTGAWELSLLFWLTAALCSFFWFLHAIGSRLEYRPSIQTMMAATFLAALAGLIIGQTGLLSRQETRALAMTSVAFSVWTSLAVEVAFLIDRWRIWSWTRWATQTGLLILVGLTVAMAFILAWKDKFARNLNSNGSWPAQEGSFPWPLGVGTDSILDLRWFFIWILVTLIAYACARIAARWFPFAASLNLDQPSEPMRKFRLRWWIARCQELLVVQTAVVSGLLVWVLVRPSGLVLPPEDAADAYRSMDHVAREMEADLIDVSMLDSKVAVDRKRFDTKAFVPLRNKLARVTDLHVMRVPIVGAKSDVDVDLAVRQRALARTMVFAAQCQMSNVKCQVTNRTKLFGRW